MTGIVLWTTNAAVKTAPIQLEFVYMRYDQLSKGHRNTIGRSLTNCSSKVAGRKHQLVSALV